MNTFFNHYIIHLIDGTNIPVLDKEETPYKKSLVYEYLYGENEFMNVCVGLTVDAYIPKKNILFLTNEGITEGTEFPTEYKAYKKK